MSTIYHISKDNASTPITGEGSCVNFSDNCQYFTLTANVVTVAVVPELYNIGMKPPLTQSPIKPQKYLAEFSFDGQVWVMPSETPVLTLPDSVVRDTTAELNPTRRVVYMGQLMQFLSTADASVSIRYYLIPWTEGS